MDIDIINKFDIMNITSQRENLINEIKNKYNNIQVDNLVQYFYDRLGYNNINMPIEKEIYIKNYLNKKINTNSIINYSHKTINQLILEFYRSNEYEQFVNDFNKKLSRSLFLHNYIPISDIEGFLENCNFEELEYLKNF